MGAMQRVLAAGLVWAAPVAWAAEPVKPYDVKTAFEETDANHDGRIDLGEFHARTVEIFYHGDLNKDGSLSVEELKVVVVFPERFEESDRNGDGKLVLAEFEATRVELFQEADADDDGGLSLAEVEEAAK